jgi:hypothetical protein
MKTHFFRNTFFALLILNSIAASAQIPVDFKMVNAAIDSKDELVVKPSGTSSKDDFNFLTGNWTMDNRRLKTRLNNSTEWIEYKSTSENLGPILNGIGNLDFYRTDFNQVNNTKYEGLTLRLFNPATRLWSLYWVDSNLGVLDPPVVGSFEGSVGTFYCKDTFQGKPILVVFLWDKTDPDNPLWAQAFSADNGKTWEMNLTNVSHRIGKKASSKPK